MSESSVALQNRTLHEIALCCQALDDKKAESITVLNVREVSSITDYFVLASGTSDPHLKALNDAVQEALKKHDIHTIGTEQSQNSGWIVLDAFDFMLHLFDVDTRNNYSLETLWKDATIIEWREYL